MSPGEISFDLNIGGYAAKVTIGGSVLSAHIGAGVELYYNSEDKSIHAVGLLHAGLGLGVKGAVDITIPVGDIVRLSKIGIKETLLK